jgi:hypothetical protein
MICSGMREDNTPKETIGELRFRVSAPVAIDSSPYESYIMTCEPM